VQIDSAETGANKPLRLKIGLGAGIVLVLLLAAVGVVVSALSPHGSTAIESRPRGVHTVRSVLPDVSPGGMPDGSPDGSADVSAGAGADAAPDATHSSIDFVHVVGEVANPGVYELPAGSRLVDAVAAAGGFTLTADQADLNLAQVVTDGQQIVVATRGASPVAGSAPGGDGTASPGTGPTGPVNINSADLTGLQTLDGIGPSLAQRILAYRAAHGGFRSVNDLRNVTGIGPKKFAAIKSNITT
jgi:competence protein ComEA